MKGYPFLVAKLSSRKNLTCGVITKRPCFCGLGADAARLVCPAHPLWPAVMGRAPCGQPLPKAVNRRNFNRALKAIFARMQVPRADRYSSHAFRRGSAQEMIETGSPLTVVASAGMWRSNALVKNYIDMAATVESNIRRLFRVDPDSESDMEVRRALGFLGGIPFAGRYGRSSHGYRGFFRYISSAPLSDRFGAV